MHGAFAHVRSHVDWCRILISGCACGSTLSCLLPMPVLKGRSSASCPATQRPYAMRGSWTLRKTWESTQHTSKSREEIGLFGLAAAARYPNSLRLDKKVGFPNSPSRSSQEPIPSIMNIAGFV